MRKLLLTIIVGIISVGNASALETRLTGELSYVVQYDATHHYWFSNWNYTDVAWQVDDQVGDWTIGFELDQHFNDASIYANHPTLGDISLYHDHLSWHHFQLGNFALGFETHLNHPDTTIFSFEGNLAGMSLEGSISNDTNRYMELTAGSKFSNFSVEAYFSGSLNDTVAIGGDVEVGIEVQGVDFKINSNLDAEVQWNDIAIKTHLGDGDAFMPFQIEYRPQLTEHLVLDSNLIFDGETLLLAELIMEF